MADFVNGSSRQHIRESLSKEDFERLQRSGQLVVDGRRRRPRYFDGRFLVADDLVREQNYFLSRQADLAKALGAGVVHGLTVHPDQGVSGGNVAIIDPGHGMTVSGEMVMLSRPLRLDFNDVATSERLGVAFDLLVKPHDPGRSLTGLFVLALRPVEFTAHPITSYPSSLEGTRQASDGDVIEAAAAVLIPYGDRSARESLADRRRSVARDVFVLEDGTGQPAGTLPLAVIALDRGVIQWIDAYLVRREVGAEHRDLLSMGFAPRALREAHLLQYHQQLGDVLMQLRAGNRSLRFAAAEYFEALPAAGRMPAAAIDLANFTQTFFPPEVDCELSAIPLDEIPGLIEDSLLAPPIDLMGEREDLDATALLVLIPVPRPKIRALRATVTNLTRPLRPAAPGFLAQRKPLEMLLARPVATALAPLPVQRQQLIDAAWRNAFAGVEFCWYVRRRTLNFKAEAAGHALRIFSDEVGDELALVDRLKKSELYNRFHHLKSAASAEADAEMVLMLSSPKFAASRTLQEGALTELRDAHRTLTEAAPPQTRVLLDRASVMKVAQRYSDPDFGKGIARLEATQPTLRDNETVIKTLTRAAVVPQLDLVARQLPEKDFAAFASDVRKLSEAGKADALNQLINAKLGEIVR
jgi:hypothetical protein